ncbi:MAG: PPOX class F420-dependent oxidoreductase [Chloroflexota bacterium]
MSITIPESHIDLLSGPYYAILTTVAPNGQPENTVVWCSWDGTHVLVNTAIGRRKDENVRQNPLVALTVIDPDNPYHWIDVRGEVVELAPDEDFANINAHAKLYAGKDEYYGGFVPLSQKQDRVILKIAPKRVLAFPSQ